jgi:hypothetical protein
VGKILHTSLSSRDEKKLRAAFGASDEWAGSRLEPQVQEHKMSEISESIQVSVEAAEGGTEQQDTQVQPQVSQAQPDQPPELEFEDLQLLSRLLVGLLLTGSDQLMQMVRGLQREIEADPGLRTQVVADDETTLDLLRYLTIGLLARGQKRVARGVSKGLRLSLSATGWTLRTLDRWTDNRFTRPFRRPIESRLWNLEQETDLIIKEGRVEEQNARLLANRTVGEIIDELLDFMSENPDLAEFVREQIGQQSVGLAGVVRDNARQVSTTADYIAEGVVRRLLRRRSRRELPPSPLMGKPQTMYSLEGPAQGGDDHGG